MSVFDEWPKGLRDAYRLDEARDTDPADWPEDLRDVWALAAVEAWGEDFSRDLEGALAFCARAEELEVWRWCSCPNFEDYVEHGRLRSFDLDLHRVVLDLVRVQGGNIDCRDTARALGRVLPPEAVRVLARALADVGREVSRGLLSPPNR